jgi:transcriptional regulator with XRE-family HTH domain
MVTLCEFPQNASMPMDRLGVKTRTRRIREAIGKGPTQLSSELGLKRNAWGQYEDPKYKRCITLDVAIRLKEAYGVSLDWLFMDDRLASLPDQLVQALKKIA